MIRTSTRQILTSLLLIYLSGLVLAPDSCTRTARAQWPAVALDQAAAPWLGPQERAMLNHLQEIGVREFHAVVPAALWVMDLQCSP